MKNTKRTDAEGDTAAADRVSPPYVMLLHELLCAHKRQRLLGIFTTETNVLGWNIESDN